MLYVNDSRCKVYEVDSTFEVDMSLEDVLELSCKYYGSSFDGRIKGSKYYLHYNYKLPIIVDEMRDIIIFPTKTYGNINNNIICLKNILDYEKKGNNIVLYVDYNKCIEIDDSYKLFENQYFKAVKLKMRLKRIKNTSLWGIFFVILFKIG